MTELQLFQADNVLPILSIEPFTFQDYPGKMACIFWFTGCNLRCPYCHNPDLVFGKNLSTLNYAKILDFLQSRQGQLEGVVLSGGECTLFSRIADLARVIHALGFLVKIDSNGTNFPIIQQLVDDELVDAVGLDFKAPPKAFSKNTQQSLQLYQLFQQTLQLLVHTPRISLEVRTTVHTDLLTETDINEMIDILVDVGYQGTYYLQPFVYHKQKSILDPKLSQNPRALDMALIHQPQAFQVVYRG